MTNDHAAAQDAAPEQDIDAFLHDWFTTLAKAQERLPEDMQRVLDQNRWRLYAK